MGCSSTKTNDQTLEAMKWFFGQRECRSTTFADDLAGDQTGSYFDLNTQEVNGEVIEEKQYFILMSGTTPSITPTPAGKTKIEVVYANGDSKEDLAALYVIALAAAGVKATDLGVGVVEVENNFWGAITVEDYASAGDITLVVNGLGFGGELGAIQQGGGNLSTSQELEDVKQDDLGETIVNQILKGAGVSLELALREMNTARWNSLVGKGYGDISGQAVGYGTSKLYRSAFEFAAQLTGHPVRLPLSDLTNDITIWKTVASLNSSNYSGSEIQSAEMEFVGLVDSSKPSEVNIFLRGDHTLF